MSTLQDMIIQSALNEKLSGSEIAKKYGCGQAYVSETLKFAGIEDGHRIDWTTFDDAIKELLEDNKSIAEISEILGIKYWTLRYHCRMSGLSKCEKIATPKPIEKKVTELYDSIADKIRYDVTDFFIDNPRKCNVPIWKKQLQLDGRMYFGKYIED